MTDLSENIQDTRDSMKTAVLNKELKSLNVDTAALQEKRLSESGTLKEEDYTFYWQGKGSDKQSEHGVGLAVRNSLRNTVEPGSNGSERLLALRLSTSTGPVILVSAYAPTLSSTPNTKDEFYKTFASIISSTPSNEQIVLLGDLNARVGREHDTWPSYLRSFDVGSMNENGQRLLELCTYHNVCMANTYFKAKSQHKVS